MNMLSKLARIPLRAGRTVLREITTELRQIGTPSKLVQFDRLQLGAGPNALPGWGNVDLEGDNIRWDLTRPLPVEPGSIRFIYTEHFIEHVTRDEASAILRNCFESLMPSGRIRISTPDLAVFIKAYNEGAVIQMPHGSWFPQSPCQMINEALGQWGHKYVFDEPELTGLLAAVGFTGIERMKRGESNYAELTDLETRPDYGDLIVEAMKSP